MPHVPRARPGREEFPAGRGYVYLIEMSGVYKIGRCRSWRSRSRSYSGMPYAVKLVCLLQSNDTHSLERSLHARYGRSRMGGEWFSLTAAEVGEILSHPLRVPGEV